MPKLRTGGPYIWPTWVTSLLTGESSCEWRAWFHAQHDGRSWVKIQDGNDFNLTQWRIRHTELLRQRTECYEHLGYSVTIEGENDFMLNLEGATISGKPDLVARNNGEVIIEDAKTGQPRASHHVQVMAYMLLMPSADRRFADVPIRGVVSYPDHNGDIPADVVNDDFERILRSQVSRLAASEPARKAPSTSECRFCPIGSQYCPERVEPQAVASS